MRAEPISLASDVPTKDIAGRVWWLNYCKLVSEKHTHDAVRVLDLDTDYIVDRGIFGKGGKDRDYARWPSNRVRRGLVMGAVQSGKTASLLGVTAKALDSSVDIVVILAGTRVSLWRQTYERVVNQLDTWSPEVEDSKRRQRVLLPAPHRMLDVDVASGLGDLYYETPNLVRRMLKGGRPLVAVVMKQTDHLERFGKYLRDVLSEVLPSRSSGLHMLILDDEADDGSILDSAAEVGFPLESERLKQIPRSIVRLWSSSTMRPETFHERLFTTYIAYTATPQANFLQSDHNPLSPSDFVVSLRSPYSRGSVEPPRSSTYLDPQGIKSYYTGGEIFYQRETDATETLCEQLPFPDRDQGELTDEWLARVDAARQQLLGSALRNYFVGGALRLLHSGKRFSSLPADSALPLDELLGLLPEHHTMLYHPSASVSSHFVGALDVLRWSGVVSDEWNSSLVLSPDGLERRLRAEREGWIDTLRMIKATREKLALLLPGGERLSRVSVDDWDDIERLLIEEVFPNTSLEVINSDPRSEDRPNFDPRRVGGGLFIQPKHLYTVFVSGNVMSRGVTLEGLTTSLFLRSAHEPASDTQMQMQRWFGYRGRYLHLCKVFGFSDQVKLFSSYHQNDEALRAEILSAMNSDEGVASRPVVLQGAEFKATGKIANLRALPLCPGADPFIRVVDTSGFAGGNLNILRTLLTGESWRTLSVGGIERGQVMERSLTMLEVASVLESFRYRDHDPSALGVNNSRWRSLALAHDIKGPEAPIYRAPDRGGAAEAVAPNSCPYAIAAYLRLWQALLSRRAKGISPTDNPDLPWSVLNLRSYAETAPRFCIGVRYGSEGSSADPILRKSGIQLMRRGLNEVGLLSSTWGSRNPGSGNDAYLGDQLFDYHTHEHTPPKHVDGEPLWRPRGAPGLLLFHVLGGEGAVETLTAGIALPRGGPDHIAALRQQL